MMKLRKSILAKKEGEAEPGEAEGGKKDCRWASEGADVHVVVAKKTKRVKKRKTSKDNGHIFINLMSFIISRSK